MSNVWRKCDVCKKEILYNQTYQKCSVSSCRKFAFCSVDCWDIHQATLNHKSAWAEEERAPSGPSEQKERGRRRIVVSPSQKNSSDSQNKIIGSHNHDLPRDVLIVISKLKSYIKAKSDMNTSGDVGDVLSDYVRVLVDEAINEARAEGRKTVMGRDFKKSI